MSREQLVEMVRRNIAHVKAGTVDQEPDVFRVPAAYYHDPDRWRLEMDQVFRRLPLVVGFTAELRDPGDYKALEIAGVPLLLSRGPDSAVRAFVNMCSHRGAIVVPEGRGSGRRFACPYHNWTYDQHGDLVGIYDRAIFGEIDTSCLGLTPLPVAERAGIIWAGLTPGTGLDLDTHLCGYGEMLDHLGFEGSVLVGEQKVDGPNWKVAYDGYVDFYHLPILHKETFGPDMSNKALYDAWGPHQRVTRPDEGFLKWEDTPEDEWSEAAMINGVWTIFPHVSIASFDADGKVYMVSQLYPGADPDSSTTTQTFLMPGAEPTDAQREKIAEVMGFLLHVVRDEDYYTGLRIQRAVKTGAKQDFLFGRNEGGGQRFHRWVQALIDTSDDGLDELFRSGIDARR